jgi:hypothetical protein
MPNLENIENSLHSEFLKSCSRLDRPTSVFDKNYLFSPYDRVKEKPEASFEPQSEVIFKISFYS